jgi:mevalonate pyrophosphate decarboxylase
MNRKFLALLFVPCTSFCVESKVIESLQELEKNINITLTFDPKMINPAMSYIETREKDPYLLHMLVQSAQEEAKKFAREVKKFIDSYRKNSAVMTDIYPNYTEQMSSSNGSIKSIAVAASWVLTLLRREQAKQQGKTLSPPPPAVSAAQ